MSRIRQRLTWDCTGVIRSAWKRRQAIRREKRYHVNWRVITGRYHAFRYRQNACARSRFPPVFYLYLDSSAIFADYPHPLSSFRVCQTTLSDSKIKYCPERVFRWPSTAFGVRPPCRFMSPFRRLVVAVRPSRDFHASSGPVTRRRCRRPIRSLVVVVRHDRVRFLFAAKIHSQRVSHHLPFPACVSPFFQRVARLYCYSCLSGILTCGRAERQSVTRRAHRSGSKTRRLCAGSVFDRGAPVMDVHATLRYVSVLFGVSTTRFPVLVFGADERQSCSFIFFNILTSKKKNTSFNCPSKKILTLSHRRSVWPPISFPGSVSDFNSESPWIFWSNGLVGLTSPPVLDTYTTFYDIEHNVFIIFVRTFSPYFMRCWN